MSEGEAMVHPANMLKEVLPLEQGVVELAAVIYQANNKIITLMVLR